MLTKINVFPFLFVSFPIYNENAWTNCMKDLSYKMCPRIVTTRKIINVVPDV